MSSADGIGPAASRVVVIRNDDPSGIRITTERTASLFLIDCALPNRLSRMRSITGVSRVGYVDTRLFIGGAWQDAADGRTLAVHNPATGEEIGRVAHASRADLDRALDA